MTKRPMIDNPEGGREVPEWIGKTPDSVPPPHVVARILKRHKNKCYKTGIELKRRKDWQLDHKTALADGGENRESNMGPLWTGAHTVKTADENKARAKIRKKFENDKGIQAKPAKPMQGRGFPQSEKRPKIDKSSLPPLKRRNIFTGEVYK